MPDELMTPTKEEARNGWTPETLTAYHKKQNESSQRALDWRGRPRPRPTTQNKGTYSAWRFGWAD